MDDPKIEECNQLLSNGRCSVKAIGGSRVFANSPGKVTDFQCKHNIPAGTKGMKVDRY